MAKAAFQKLIKVSKDNVTFYKVAGLDDASLKRGGEVPDITHFGDDPAGWTKRLKGIKDWSIEVSGDYEGEDVNGQQAILESWLNGSNLYVQYLPDGVTGVQGKCIVETIDEGGGVKDKETFSCTMQADGALSIVSE